MYIDIIRSSWLDPFAVGIAVAMLVGIVFCHIAALYYAMLTFRGFFYSPQTVKSEKPIIIPALLALFYIITVCAFYAIALHYQ